MNIGPKYQRGYAVIPYLASLFTTAGGAAAAGGGAAAAGGAAAGAGAAAAGTAAAAGGISAGAAAASAAATIGAGVLASKVLAPKTPNMAGNAPPSIDETKQAQQTADRIRLRKGVLANIYGGGTGGTPTIGTKALLGQ